ncbi:MAG: hypothetical protein ACXABY_25400 [Candidatus Thorarchaeota archaeon]
MKKVQIELAFYSKGTWKTEDWTGYETDIPGIVVCRKPLWTWDRFDMHRGDNIGHWKPGGTWQVIHTGSGRPLHHKNWNIRTRALAMEAANNLPKMDWTRGAQEMRHIEGLMAVTYATIQEVL